MRMKSLRMAAAAFAAVALAGLGLIAPTSAMALPSPIIDPAATVNLHIAKFLGNTTGQPNNGTQQTVSGTPLAGVHFDVYKFSTIDLTTNAGWAASIALQAHTLTAAEIAQGFVTVGSPGVNYPFALADIVITDAAGLATFTQAAGAGLYLVNENLGASTTTPPASTITPSAPFLVTLPMTDPVNLTSWMYDVYVYPKNQADSITKSVLDGNVGTANQDAYTVGQNLTYKLDSTIQATDTNGSGTITGADLGYYYVGDNLSTYVSAQSVTVSVGGTALAGCDAAAVGPFSGCDYFYWLDGDAVTAGDQVKIVMTDQGLDAIVAAKVASSSAVVTTEIVAKVTSVPGDGLIPNTGEFIPSNGWLTGHGFPPVTPPTTTTPPTTPPTTPGIPSNPVVSKYGDMQFVKYDAKTSAPLVGAEFTVYRDANFDGTCSAAEIITANQIGTPVTTAADGTVIFNDLQLSNFYNNAAHPLALHGYCLVETKAPVGYNLNAQPIPFTVTLAGDVTNLTFDITAGADNQEVLVANEPSNLGNNLPLTGGAGVAAVSIVGLLLVGGGLGYYLVGARRREIEQDV